jgi:hypothetical protein
MASALKWSLLGTAILASAGAAFALIRYQFRAATSDETVEAGETTDASGTPTTGAPAQPVTPGAPGGSSGSSGTGSPSTPSASATKTADDKTATTTDTSVNGHVTSSGW